jgi:hypothetical protein
VADVVVLDTPDPTALLLDVPEPNVPEPNVPEPNVPEPNEPAPAPDPEVVPWSGCAAPGAPVGPMTPGPPATVTGDPLPIGGCGSAELPAAGPPPRAVLPEGAGEGPRVADMLDGDGRRLCGTTALVDADRMGESGADAAAPPDGSSATPTRKGATKVPPRHRAPPRVIATTATEAAAARTGATGVYLRPATRRRTGAARNAATWADRV